MQEAYEGKRRVLGSEHPETLKTKKTLDEIQGKLD